MIKMDYNLEVVLVMVKEPLLFQKVMVFIFLIALIILIILEILI